VTFCRLGARDLGNDGTLDHILRKGNAGSAAAAGCRPNDAYRKALSPGKCSTGGAGKYTPCGLLRPERYARDFTHR
jgi:hypothetical protein